MRSGSFNSAIGATVPRSSPDSSPGPLGLGSFGVRSLWATILAPPVFAALYFGSPYSDLLILAVGAISAWEWARLCGGGTPGLSGAIVIVAVVMALVAGMLGAYSVGGWLAAVGAMAATVAASRERPASALWYGTGAAYLAAACLAFLWLRADFDRALILWLIAVVWATDIGAYLVGRRLGGPKMAPAISPGKTWSGLAGGVAAAALAGLTAALLRDQGHVGAMIGASMILALVAQVGDLFESSLKRRFDAKDSSGLIPGHGGLLDRIDGILAAVLALGGALWLTGITL